jgi:hypothetical protein
MPTEVTEVTAVQPEAPEAPAKPKLSDIYDETHAMSAAYSSIVKLDRAAQYRVLQWLSNRLSADAASTEPEEEPF